MSDSNGLVGEDVERLDNVLADTEMPPTTRRGLLGKAAATYLTGLIENASEIGIPSSLVPVLKAANAAELDHYKALRSLGAKPLTTKFEVHTIGGIVGALEKAGVGFGKKGNGPGAFYEFKTPPHSALAHLENRRPA